MRIGANVFSKFHIPSAITPAHRAGDLACTGRAVMIRELAAMKKAGKVDMSPEYVKILEEKMASFDSQFRALLGTFWRKTYYRGIIGSDNVGSKILRNAKAGDKVIPDAGYAFVSGKKNIAQDCAKKVGGGFAESSVLLEIKVPFWSKISRNPSHWSEAVMPRNAEFEVLSTKQVDGMTHVVLKYLKPKKV